MRWSEELWNGRPPQSAGKTLQSHLVRLRDAVDPQRRILQTQPPGYLLRVESECVDALQFEQLLSRARRAMSAGAAESAAPLLTEALAMWRGPAYADLRDCESLAQEASRLEEIRLDALEERISVDLLLGGGSTSFLSWRRWSLPILSESGCGDTSPLRSIAQAGRRMLSPHLPGSETCCVTNSASIRVGSFGT